MELIRLKGQSKGSAIGNKVGDEDTLLRGILMEETQNRAKGHRDFRTFAVNIAHHFDTTRDCNHQACKVQGTSRNVLH